MAQLRHALQDAVEASSLRETARQVGMSPSGLQKLLSGAEPYSATRQKLELWHSRSGRGTTPRAVLASLATLVHELPPSERAAAKGEILASVREQFDRAGRGYPGWLAAVSEELSGSE